MARTIDVLHVDDEPQLADLVADFLERDGDAFAVDTATDVPAARAMLSEGDYDCVVSDYDMPGEDGIEFLRTVRDDDPLLPFILYTGTGSEAVAGEAISAGVTDYMQKDAARADAELLANRIENAVEQVRAQRERRRSERRFEAVFEDPQMLVGILDPDGTLREANHVAMGYVDADHETVTGTPFWETPWWTEDVAGDVRGWVERAADGEYVTYDATLTDPDGSTYSLEGTVRPVTTPGGDVASLVVSARDVTERVEREAELEQSRAYLEETHDAITVLDFEGRIRYESPAIERLLGYDPAERIGDDCFDYVHPDDRGGLEETFERALADGGDIDRVEYRARHADGSWRWLESSASSHPEPPIEGFVASSRDVTDRKHREQELERYETTLDTLPDSVAIYDPDLECIYVNQTLVDVSGLTRGAFLGRSIESVLDPLLEDEAREWISTMRALVAGDRERARTRVTLPTDEGEVYMDTTAARVESEAGELLGVVNVIRDVTERVAAQRDLERQNERLEEFAGVVSHDLRNPLTVAEGYVDLARDECESEHLDAVTDAHERMGVLIDDLLSLARQGATVEETAAVDLGTLAEATWRRTETAAATLRVDTGATIRGDESRLRQLLENLFRNAVEHAGEDVTVTVGDLEGRDGFFVADDGPGIPPDRTERVFEAGYTTAEGGTGTGLKIVHDVVTGHDWAIHVTVGADGGAKFEITGVDYVES